jgi:hypothetical protein
MLLRLIYPHPHPHPHPVSSSWGYLCLLWGPWHEICVTEMDYGLHLCVEHDVHGEQQGPQGAVHRVDHGTVPEDLNKAKDEQANAANTTEYSQSNKSIHQSPCQSRRTNAKAAIRQGVISVPKKARSCGEGKGRTVLRGIMCSSSCVSQNTYSREKRKPLAVVKSYLVWEPERGKGSNVRLTTLPPCPQGHESLPPPCPRPRCRLNTNRQR